MNYIDNLQLRALEPEDASLVFVWENDRSIWQHGHTHAPLSLHQIREYINGYNGDIFAAGQLRLMICMHTQPVGMVDLYEIDPVNRRAGVGIMIAQEYRGQGMAKQTIHKLINYARHTLGLHQLWCVCAQSNLTAISAFKQCGFAINGRMRSWIRNGQSYEDAFFLQLII